MSEYQEMMNAELARLRQQHNEDSKTIELLRGDKTYLMNENAQLKAQSELHYKWSYMLMVAFAKYLLEGDDSRPVKHYWQDLVDTSKSAFLHRARKLAGIDDNEYLDIVRRGNIDVDAIYNSLHTPARETTVNRCPNCQEIFGEATEDGLLECSNCGMTITGGA